MQTLKKGSSGTLVRSLQLWLANFEPIETDGQFGSETARVTRNVQRRFELEDDGIVGPITAGRFMLEGWLPPGFDQPSNPESPYPNKPDTYKPLSVSQKIRKWGSPGTAPANATPGGPLKTDSAFSANIVRLNLRDWFPHITGVTRIDIHKKVELQWRAFFDDIVRKGLAENLLTCAGSWNPRFARGSTTVLSSHAFAAAVDFNAPENWLGAQPAQKGEKGSLVEILPLAVQYELWWGGWFSRVDGMHFESTRKDEELNLT